MSDLREGIAKEQVRPFTEDDLKALMQVRGLYNPAEDVTETATRFLADWIKREKQALPGLHLEPEEEARSQLLLGVCVRAFRENPFKKRHASGAS